jgi:ferredoxin like protein
VTTMSVDEKLAKNKYDVDEDHPHIMLRDEYSADEFHKLVMACPASLYRVDENGVRSFDYAGCLECGTCRILCGDTVLKSWEFPQATRGIEYRFG